VIPLLRTGHEGASIFELPHLRGGLRWTQEFQDRTREAFSFPEDVGGDIKVRIVDLVSFDRGEEKWNV